jgi:hypothetical protein
MGVLPFAGCTVLPVWSIFLKVVLLRSAARLSWVQATLVVAALPLVVLSLAIVLRWDFAFR